MERKIEVQETVNKIWFFAKQFLLPTQSFGLKAANELINPYGLKVYQEKVNQPNHVPSFVPFDFERLVVRRGPIIIH